VYLLFLFVILPFSVFSLLDFVVTSREVSTKLCRLSTSLVFTRRHSDFWWEGMSGTSPTAYGCLMALYCFRANCVGLSIFSVYVTRSVLVLYLFLSR
jgi:hypothetical protein